jgi:ribosomal protein L35
MAAARALVRPLSVFLGRQSSSVLVRHYFVASASSALRPAGALHFAALARAGAAAAPAAAAAPTRAAAASVKAARLVRWGSRKAGSVGTKTKSAVKKRFRVNGGGSLVRMSSGKRHLNLHKSRARVHRLGAWRCSARCWESACMRAQSRWRHLWSLLSTRTSQLAPPLFFYHRAPPLSLRRATTDQGEEAAQALPARHGPLAL